MKVYLVTVDGNGDLNAEGSVPRPRLVRSTGLFSGRVGSSRDTQQARDRARELADLYAAMKAMRYGRWRQRRLAGDSATN